MVERGRDRGLGAEPRGEGAKLAHTVWGGGGWGLALGRAT